MNAAARVLTGTRKFDRGLMQLMHDNLYWLHVPERVKYKVIILTRRCLIGTAPRYLAADCVPVSEMALRRHLCSAAGYQFDVPSYRLNCGLRGVFCTQSETVELLPRLLRVDTSHNTTSFGHSLKTLSLRVLVHRAH